MATPAFIWDLIATHPDYKQCFEMGHDAAKNGPNTTNCHFRLFRTPEHTKAWEAGQDSVLKKKPAKEARGHAK